MRFAVLATGPSMSQAVADSVRGKCKVVVVNDAFRLAPWADMLVAQDHSWWMYHKDAVDFAGHKFSGNYVHGVSKIHLPTNINSGLAGLMVAVEAGATEVLLLGFDMRPGHYFGEHPKGLKNADDLRFRTFRMQFADYARSCKVPVYNCTPGSALTCFPRLGLDEVLERPAHVAGGSGGNPGHWPKPHKGAAIH